MNDQPMISSMIDEGEIPTVLQEGKTLIDNNIDSAKRYASPQAACENNKKEYSDDSKYPEPLLDLEILKANFNQKKILFQDLLKLPFFKNKDELNKYYIYDNDVIDGAKFSYYLNKCNKLSISFSEFIRLLQSSKKSNKEPNRKNKVIQNNNDYQEGFSKKNIFWLVASIIIISLILISIIYLYKKKK